MTTKNLSGYRVRFVIDDDAQFEECNGESRPLTEEEYQQNQYMACPNIGHRQAGSYAEPKNSGIGYCARCHTRFAPVSYSGYLSYYGNPERHVYLICELEKQCECCHKFSNVQGLGNIDCMDDSPEYLHTKLDHWYSLGEVVDDPKFGYLGDVAKELRSEED